MPAANSKRNLNHQSDPAQAFRSGSDAACSVQSGGTTASNAGPFSNPEWADWANDLEYVWRRRTAEPLASLSMRARRLRRDMKVCTAQERVDLGKSADWAEHRARSLAMSRRDRVNTCGKRWRSVKCGCTTIELQVGCDAPQLCARCRRKHWRKWRQRIARSMKIHLRAARDEWNRDPRRRGMLPGIYLVTLTAPHSGDVETDRNAMGRAVRVLLKHATAQRWWRTYALTWEVTSGPTRNAPDRAPGETHLHVHMAIIASWIPYAASQVRKWTSRGTDGEVLTHASFDEWEVERSENGPRIGLSRIGVARHRGARKRKRERGLHDVWRDAMPGALVLDVQAPKRARKRGESPADYLAKYVTKGVDPQVMTGAKAGEMLAAFRGKRKVSTSAHFWRVYEKDARCPSCLRAFTGAGHPCSLRDLAPDAVLRSLVVRHRFNGWSQDELFDPWEVRPPPRDPEPVRERATKLNQRSRWVLNSGPVSTWKEPVDLADLVGWKPQHFQK